MRYRLKGLDCAACAMNIEEELRKTAGLENVTVNFATATLELPSADLLDAAKAIITRVEPEVEVVDSPTPGAASNAGAVDLNTVPNAPATTPRRHLYILSSAAFLWVIGFLLSPRFSHTPFSWVEYPLFLTSYLLVGWPVLKKAFINLFRGKVFDENFLMTLATFGAIAIHQLPEAAAVMVFYATGEYFEDLAVARSRRSISALLDIRPDYVNLLVEGTVKRVRPEEVGVGETILVRPGERIPLDGEVINGTSFLDTSALTGEPVPRSVKPGERVLAGMINGQGLLSVRVSRPFGETTVARILQLVEEAAARKAPTERFMNTFSRYYTPAVVIGALALAFLPPLFLPEAHLAQWVYRALVLLVISCPCALVISIPLGYFGGIGGASRQGILVKGANFLDALTSLETVVFDKTGTLTKGVFEVQEVLPAPGFTAQEVLAAAAAAEVHSAHPIAQSLRRAHPEPVSIEQVSDYQEIAGHGVRAQVMGRTVLVGNAKLLGHDLAEAASPVENEAGTKIYVAIDGKFAGSILIADEIKPEARVAVTQLRKLGVKNFVLLTGDDEGAARHVAATLGLDQYFARLLPEEKVQRLDELMAVRENTRGKIAFVGDGINDAPVISRADIGVAMGGLGSDAAIEAADVVLMEDDPARLATAVQIARHTRQIVRQNILLSVGIKGFFLVLGILGVATVWEGVFADVGVALLAILNASRTLKFIPAGSTRHSLRERGPARPMETAHL